eukprot:m.210902 g.210902  ORF g.210902 m.210902 type:complete len:220 (+) comp13783_c1_seq11:172-831(+)
MGCGGSKAININEPLPDLRAEKETKKRRKNKEKKHGHLMNAIDESREGAEIFWRYAAERRKEWVDWQEWLLDSEDNTHEEELRGMNASIMNLFSSMSKLDQNRIGALRDKLSKMEKLLQSFQDFDALLLEEVQAEKELDEAVRKQKVELERHNTAKRESENYPEQRQHFEQIDKNMAETVAEKKKVCVVCLDVCCGFSFSYVCLYSCSNLLVVDRHWQI